MLDKLKVMVALIYFSSVYLALRVLAFTVLGTIVLLNAILQFYLYDSEAFAFLVPFELLSDLSLDYR